MGRPPKVKTVTESTTKKTAQELKQEINAIFKSQVLKMGSDEDLVVDYLPTGVLPVDLLLHGGLPRGRFVEFYGAYSSLKSYIGLKAIAETQKTGGVCALIDTEHSFDPVWAKQIGVDIKSLIVVKPKTGELAMDAVETLLEGETDLIVFDSIAASLPQAERNRKLNDEAIQMARLAFLMSVAMRKLTSANGKTAVMWINQLRMNVGVTFGNPETTPGGKAMEFYASYRINLKKIGKITNEVEIWDGEAMVKSKEQVGQKIKMTVEKSKLSKPFRDVIFTWDYKKGGIDEFGFLFGLAMEQGLIVKEGTTKWIYKGEVTSGREKFQNLFLNDPKMMSQLKKEVLNQNLDGKEVEAPKLKVVSKKKGISIKTKLKPTRTQVRGK